MERHRKVHWRSGIHWRYTLKLAGTFLRRVNLQQYEFFPEYVLYFSSFNYYALQTYLGFLEYPKVSSAEFSEYSLISQGTEAKMNVVSGPLQCPVPCPGSPTRGNKDPSYPTPHDIQPSQMLPLECSSSVLCFLLCATPLLLFLLLILLCLYVKIQTLISFNHFPSCLTHP